MEQSKKVCPICYGTGYIPSKHKETAFGVEYEFYEECKCKSGAVRPMMATNLNPDIFSKKTFKTFKAETDEQKEMLKRAKMFVAAYEKGNSFGLFGNSGTGKSHICIALCRELVKEYNLSMKYFDYRKEIQRLRALYFQAEAYNNELELWLDTDVLYIDDLFKFGTKNGELIEGEAQVMYSIINGRYLDGKTTIFSSEMSVNDITELDEALGSRIYEMIGKNGFRTNGFNYRTA